MGEQGRIVGIDLGTTNTLVASVRNRVARVVHTDAGPLMLPSVVALGKGGELLVGKPAKDQMVTNPKDTIWGAKRLIGRKFDSRVVQRLRGYYPYEIVEGSHGEAAVRMGGKVYALPEISAMLLRHVRTVAEASLGGPVTQAVITVPAYYNDHQRTAVKEAGTLAGFDVKRIVNEPTAAALSYGFNKGLDQRVLVYDLGGGTFDVSVLHVTGNVFEVLASGGDTFLGGVDFDQRVMQYALEAFRREAKADLQDNPIAMQRLTSAAEAAKIDLTLVPNVAIDLPFIADRRGKPVDLHVDLTRDQLNALTRDLVERTLGICDEVLAQRGIARDSIDEVILVGGQSRMPLVQQRLTEAFGKAPRKGVHPDECVAVGAALLADSLTNLDAVTLLDALSMPIGYGVAGGRFRAVIPKNTSLPALKSFRAPLPREDAGDVEIDVFQGDSDQVVDNEYLGSVRLPATLAGARVDFKVDEECILHVLVERSGRLERVTLATRDTPAELKQAIERELAAAASAPAAPKQGGVLTALKRFWGPR